MEYHRSIDCTLRLKDLQLKDVYKVYRSYNKYLILVYLNGNELYSERYENRIKFQYTQLL